MASTSLSLIAALCLLFVWAEASAPGGHIQSGYSYQVETVPQYGPVHEVKQVAPIAPLPAYRTTVIKESPQYRPATVVKEIPQYRPTTYVKEVPAVEYRPTSVVKEVPAVEYRKSIEYRPTTVSKEVPAVEYRPTTVVKQVPAVEYRPTTVVKQVPAVEYRKRIEYRPTTVAKEIPAVEYRKTSYVKEVPSVEYRPTYVRESIPQYEVPVYVTRQTARYNPRTRGYDTPRGYSHASDTENKYYYPSGYGQGAYVQAYKPSVLSTVTGVRIPTGYYYPEERTVKTKSIA